MKLSKKDISFLLRLARKAMTRAYSPYSGIKIGAALLSESGNSYLGANIANSCSTLNCCAEQVAINVAVMNGDKTYSAIAIVDSIGNKVVPCGRCLQLLSEFSEDMIVITKFKKHIETHSLKHLLPLPYQRSEGKNYS